MSSYPEYIRKPLKLRVRDAWRELKVKTMKDPSYYDRQRVAERMAVHNLPGPARAVGVMVLESKKVPSSQAEIDQLIVGLKWLPVAERYLAMKALCRADPEVVLCIRELTRDPEYLAYAREVQQ